MSFISNGVEYALHCLLFLISPSGGRKEANVRGLAALQGVSVDYLAKLFTKLSKAGLVVATEGSRGGFALSRPAEEISFLDVVVAIDGDKPLFECRETRARCAVFGSKAPAWSGHLCPDKSDNGRSQRFRGACDNGKVSLIDQTETLWNPELSRQTAIWKPHRQDRLHASGFLISCSKRAQESKGEITWLK